MAWGLVARKGSYHKWHIDADGFATFLDIICGVKVWIVAKPADLSQDQYGSREFSLKAVNPFCSDSPEGYVFEAVALTSSEML